MPCITWPAWAIGHSFATLRRRLIMQLQSNLGRLCCAARVRVSIQGCTCKSCAQNTNMTTVRRGLGVLIHGLSDRPATLGYVVWGVPGSWEARYPLGSTLRQ